MSEENQSPPVDTDSFEDAAKKLIGETDQTADTASAAEERDDEASQQPDLETADNETADNEAESQHEEKPKAKASDYWRQRIEEDRRQREERQRLRDEVLTEVSSLPPEQRLAASGLTKDQALDLWLKDLGGQPDESEPQGEIGELRRIVQQQQQQIAELLQDRDEQVKERKRSHVLKATSDSDAYEVTRDVYGEAGADLALELQGVLSKKSGRYVPLTDALELVEEQMREAEKQRLKSLGKTSFFKSWLAEQGYTKTEKPTQSPVTKQKAIAATIPGPSGDTASPRTLTEAEALAESAKLLGVE